ncbi:hypothetical protein [uncultured Amphritea sp.]|uniref:hypothetical protein n=1 Tax=uncultured Amphritea sp. TaxID=981605 RepID=UPI002603B8AD|nr:hypothetical protein [uncultured Amphritea sp.]
MRHLWEMRFQERDAQGDLVDPITQEMFDSFPSASAPPFWFVFVSSHPGTVGAIVLDDVMSEHNLLLDELAWFTAKLLVQEPRPVIQYTKKLAGKLWKHPAWRVWKADYGSETGVDELRESDWNYVGNIVEAGMPEAIGAWPAFDSTITADQAREIMVTAIKAYS